MSNFAVSMSPLNMMGNRSRAMSGWWENRESRRTLDGSRAHVLLVGLRSVQVHLEIMGSNTVRVRSRAKFGLSPIQKLSGPDSSATIVTSASNITRRALRLLRLPKQGITDGSQALIGLPEAQSYRLEPFFLWFFQLVESKGWSWSATKSICRPPCDSRTNR